MEATTTRGDRISDFMVSRPGSAQSRYLAAASLQPFWLECSRRLAGWAAAGVPTWRILITPAVYDSGPEGEAKQRELAASFDVNHRRMYEIVEVEAPYSDAGSPLIADEPGNVAEWEISRHHRFGDARVILRQAGELAPHTFVRLGDSAGSFENQCLIGIKRRIVD
jgi:hypothetical protein